MAWNTAISRWRRLRLARMFTQRQRPKVVDGPGPDRVALTAALATLPTDHRRAVVLFYLADLTVNEIAEDCGVAPGTVKSWLHRARTALAAHLGDVEPARRGGLDGGEPTRRGNGSAVAADGPTRRTVD